jgi:serine O-acetyltransferase
MNISALLQPWFNKSVIPDPLIDLSSEEHTLISKIFQTDYERYYPAEEINITKLLWRLELQGILCYRVSRLLFLKGDERCNAVSSLGRFLSAFELYYSADIDEGLKINHGMGLVVGARVHVGKRAVLHHNVTLGEGKGGRPTLGDDVMLYPGCSVLGNIRVGNRAVVGANSVCLIDVPDGKVAAGVPAKIIQ